LISGIGILVLFVVVIIGGLICDHLDEQVDKDIDKVGEDLGISIEKGRNENESL
jgi:hypothetical protein